MEDILSPIAKLDIDDFGSESSYRCNLKLDDINGNYDEDDSYKSKSINTKSLQSSLENLVNNFDSIISECFCDTDERIDSFSPLGDNYQSKVKEFDEKSHIWLSLTGSLDKTLNIDWKKFKTYQEFKNVMQQYQKDDITNQNLDLPDDEELTQAMDHHSQVTGCLPCDFEPLKTADEIIDEIDDILGIHQSEVDSDYLVSSLHRSDFVGSQEAISSSKMLLQRSNSWSKDLMSMSTNQLNSIVDELEEAIRNYSSILVEELAEREELEDEKEERDLFVELMYQINVKQSQLMKSSQGGQPNVIRNNNIQRVINTELHNQPHQQHQPQQHQQQQQQPQPKRSNSWKSIFTSSLTSSSTASSTISLPNDNNNNKQYRNQSAIDSTTCYSSENINNNQMRYNDTLLSVTIPAYSDSIYDKSTLQTFNRLLQTLLRSSNDQFNQLLTEYILNIYAPADEDCGTGLPYLARDLIL